MRHATLTLLAAFMRTLGPQPILNALGGTFVHPEWRVREKGVTVVLQASIQHRPRKVAQEFGMGDKAATAAQL